MGSPPLVRQRAHIAEQTWTIKTLPRLRATALNPLTTSMDGVLARRHERREKEAAETGKNPEEGLIPGKDAEDDGPPGEEPEPTADEADAPGAEEAPELEAGDSEPEFAHGNLKVRFRDGSETTVGDLKKGREELQELKRQVPDVLAARQEIEQVKAHLAQQQQQFEQVLPLRPAGHPSVHSPGA
jgi:hypothetical protein